MVYMRIGSVGTDCVCDVAFKKSFNVVLRDIKSDYRLSGNYDSPNGNKYQR